VEKEAACLGVVCCSKFVKGSTRFVAGRICVAVVEFLRSQQVVFLSNLCLKPWKGVERPEGL
jgi:hypothetical protein